MSEVQIAKPPTRIPSISKVSRDTSGKITVAFPYDSSRISKIKTIEGHKWNPDKKRWSFQDSEGMLNKILVVMALGVMLLISNTTTAISMEATTSDGKKVILFPNGTWIYKDSGVQNESGSNFTKPQESTKVLKSKKGFFTLWIDPTKWNTEGSSLNPDAEFFLRHTSGDVYAMVIAERIAMPIATLKNLTLENAKRVVPDAEIVLQEERIVNGTKLWNMRIEGTLQGIPITYYGYYWTGQVGSLQVVTYTGKNLFDEFKAEITDLLNGLVITKP